MAKARYLTVGSVIKSKEANLPDYIKINQDVTLRTGDILSLESKQQALKKVEYLLSSKKITEDVANAMAERANKMPDFVRFNIIQKTEE